MTRKPNFTSFDFGTEDARRVAGPLRQAEALLEASLLVRVEANLSFPVLISGARFMAAFPKARPNASFLSLFEPGSRGLAATALQSVAARGLPVTLACVRRASHGPARWIDLMLDPIVLAPGAPGRILGRLMGDDAGDPGVPLQALAVRSRGGASPQTPAIRYGMRGQLLRLASDSSSKHRLS